ncbi:hypothetical protein KKI17_02370 [Patescibacteria group bacterium]|nr:hypothetical protein [Patescibacteria group bacterium]
MTTITLPKALKQTEKNLIAVPQGVYREFLAWQKRIKSQRTYRPTKAEKEALQQGRKNLSKRDYTELSRLRHELGGSRS